MEDRNRRNVTRDRDKPSTFKATMFQVLATAAANLASLSPGMNLGFSAVALPQLQSANSTIPVTEEEGSWIASIAAIATPIGCLIIGPIMDRFGRKLALLSVNVPCIFGWLLIATAHNVPMIYAGRVLTGLALGLSSIPGPVYVGEVVQPHLRGMLVCWNSISMALGILIVYVLGSFLDWRTVAGISTVFPLTAYIVMSLFPESPAWLMSKGQVEDAEKALLWLRAKSPYAKIEFEDVVSNGPKNNRESTTLREALSMFTRPEGYKPFIIMNVFFFFQQFSGIYVVIFYAVNVVREASDDINEYLATILIGLSRLLVTIFLSVAMRKFGRRPPAIISGVGMTVCMGTLALYTYLEGPDKKIDNPNYSWIPVTAIVLYIFTSTIGFLTLPWAMVGEMFPSKIRGIASGAATCLANIFSFITVKVYPDMLRWLGNYGVFFFFGVMSLVGTIFVIFCLPETKGKTLQEIEDYFAGASAIEKIPGNNYPKRILVDEDKDDDDVEA